MSDTQDDLPDRYACYANVAKGRGKLRNGAKVLVRYAPGGDDERMMVVGLSPGGRRIEIWVKTEHLTNPRISTVPPEHPHYSVWGAVDSREKCEYMVTRIENANV